MSYIYSGQAYYSAHILNRTEIIVTPMRQAYTLESYLPLWACLQHRVGRSITAHHAQMWGMVGSSITWTNWTSIKPGLPVHIFTVCWSKNTTIHHIHFFCSGHLGFSLRLISLAPFVAHKDCLQSGKVCENNSKTTIV